MVLGWWLGRGRAQGLLSSEEKSRLSYFAQIWSAVGDGLFFSPSPGIFPRDSYW